MVLPRGSQGRKRVPLGDDVCPRKFRIPFLSLSAGATLAFCQVSRSIPVTRPLSTARVASKRGQKNRPFNDHPEVCARPAIAAQDPRKGTDRREPVEDCPVLVSTHSGQPPYISQLARRRKFGAKRSFLLDRPRPVFFSARPKRKWGVECPAIIMADAPRPIGRTPPKNFSHFRELFLPSLRQNYQTEPRSTNIGKDGLI